MTSQFARVGDIDIHYDLSDYTDPWRGGGRETLLLYSGYCRTMEFWRAWVPLLGRERAVRAEAIGLAGAEVGKEAVPDVAGAGRQVATGFAAGFVE